MHKPRRPFSIRLGSLATHVHLAGHFGRNYLRKYYFGTYLGLLWLPFGPVLNLLMQTLLFGAFLGVSPGNRPYLVFLLIGSIGWYFFARATYWAWRSLQYNREFFRTVPVPWLPAITGAAVPGAVYAGLYALIAVVVCVYYKLTQGSFYVSFGPDSAYALLGLLLLVLYAWTVGLLIAPLVRVVRDVRLAVRYPLAFWYMVTPVLYSVQTLPPRYRPIALYNPLTAPVEFMRHGLLQMSFPATASIITSVGVLAVVMPLALLVFFRAEHSAHSRL